MMTKIHEQSAGQWKNDKKNGKGKFYFASGSKYSGDWVDDKKEGEGVYTWTGGGRYEMCCSQIPWQDFLC